MSFLARIVSIEDLSRAEKEMLKIGAAVKGVKIMAPKAVFRAVKLKDVSATAANILKQDMLSRGGEAATSHGTIDHADEKTDVLLLGTLAQYRSLTGRLKTQQFKLPEIAAQIENLLDQIEKNPSPILGMEFGKKTFTMGILNVTPDSFSDGGKFTDPESAVSRAKQMADDGADIIDVGGESTRPGSSGVSAEEEIKRVVPVISRISSRSDRERKIISIDTRKSAVAEAAIRAGAKIINDISGLRFDPNMASVAAKHGAPVIIMHSKGTPDIMQNDPKYDDLVSEILSYFEESINIAKNAGLPEENIILDPGIGFGKTLEHNIEMLRRLDEFKCFGRPLCVGPSRKSFIGMILGQGSARDRDEGTSAAIALAISRKVDIIRIHNTGFMCKVVKMSDAIIRR